MCVGGWVWAWERGWQGGWIQSICIRSRVCRGQTGHVRGGQGEDQQARAGMALWLIAEIISHVVQKELKEELFNLDIKNIICPL